MTGDPPRDIGDFCGYAQWLGVRRQARGDSGKGRDLLDSVLACSVATSLLNTFGTGELRDSRLCMLLSCHVDGKVMMSVYCTAQ